MAPGIDDQFIEKICELSASTRVKDLAPYHDWHRRLGQEEKCCYSKRKTKQVTEFKGCSPQFSFTIRILNISSYLSTFDTHHAECNIRFESHSGLFSGLLPCAPLVPPVAQIQRSQIQPFFGTAFWRRA